MESLYQPDAPQVDVARLCWRHKGKMSLAALVILALTLTYLSLAPRSYVSEAKLYVRVGHETATIDPTATTGQFIAVSDTRESEVNTVEQLIGSRSLAEQVVDAFGPEKIVEKGSHGGPSVGERLEFLNQYNLNPLRVYSLRDKAIESFCKNLGVTTGKKSSIITVSYTSKDPVLARDVLQSMWQLGREEYLRVNRTTGSHAFFTAQSERLRTALEGKEESLRTLKDASGLASLPTQRDSQLALLGSLQSELVLAEAEQAAVEAELAVLGKKLADLPAMIVTEQTTGQPQTPRQTMREKLYDLEISEQELASTLKADAPLLIQIRSQIAEARKIAAIEESTTEIKRGVNQAHQAAGLAHQDRETRLAALKARIGALSTSIEAATRKLVLLNDQELQIARLERDIDVARVSFRKYVDNLEQARIDEELHAANISSLSLLQPPSLSETPASPNPKVTLALGIVAAGFGAIGMALLGERRARLARPAPFREPSSAHSPARARLGDVAPANPT